MSVIQIGRRVDKVRVIAVESTDNNRKAHTGTPRKTHQQTCTAVHSTAQHISAQHSTAQPRTAQHSTTKHSTAQHSCTHRKRQDRAGQYSTAQYTTAPVSYTHLTLPTIYPVQITLLPVTLEYKQNDPIKPPPHFILVQ